MKNHALKSGGFTMIELLVTIGVSLMLTGVVLANYRTFSTNAEFANASEDVVLALRQAQVYGAGTKGNTTVCPPVTGTSFACAYGVFLTLFEPQIITVFIDVNNNKIYDLGEQLGDAVKWSKNISITSLQCGVLPCTGRVGGGEMNVTFIRPNPDAYITDASGALFDKGTIVLTDAKTGKNSTITLTSAGQISVQ